MSREIVNKKALLSLRNHAHRAACKIKTIAIKCRKKATFPNVIIFLGILTAVIYVFSFVFPFTDNAFVVNEVRPVASQVSGYITRMYVKNGDRVKRGQKLFSVFNKPYVYAVAQLTAELEAAEATLKALKTTYARDKKLSGSQRKMYQKLSQDLEKYRKGYTLKSVSLITMQNTEQETFAARDAMQAAIKQEHIDSHYIDAQKKQIESLQAKLNLAKVRLKQTDIYASSNGVIQNLFLTLGAPIKVNDPLFTLVYTDETYIQANFNETDLRHVHQGSKVLIFPRMYLGAKLFHGIVDSNYWSANRQMLDPRTQLQNIENENQWILLPQRLPVMIKITDPNPNYPLRAGSSAYVYIKTA